MRHRLENCESLASAELATFPRGHAKVLALAPEATEPEEVVSDGNARLREGPRAPAGHQEHREGQPVGLRKVGAGTALG